MGGTVLVDPDELFQEDRRGRYVAFCWFEMLDFPLGVSLFLGPSLAGGCSYQGMSKYLPNANLAGWKWFLEGSTFAYISNNVAPIMASPLTGRTADSFGFGYPGNFTCSFKIGNDLAHNFLILVC
jgi:hypothetical protein